MTKLRVLDLFSGIGGFSLGLERTGGFETVAFCEIEPFPRKVLAKHWPGVPCYEDVRTLTADTLARDGIAVDVICGGFPCQDISTAGKGVGIAGERSGLWKEYARLIGELRPQFAIMENVSALLGRGLNVVLGDLAEIGFNAEWHCIPASAIGAPHRRDRVWIVAYACELRCNTGRTRQPLQGVGMDGNPSLADSHGIGFLGKRIRQNGNKWETQFGFGECRQNVANTERFGRRQMVQSILERALNEKTASQIEHGSFAGRWRGWEVEPSMGRVADGVPNRVDRLKALGNAVVPQIPELIGNAILQSMKQP